MRDCPSHEPGAQMDIMVTPAIGHVQSAGMHTAEIHAVESVASGAAGGIVPAKPARKSIASHTVRR